MILLARMLRPATRVEALDGSWVPYGCVIDWTVEEQAGESDDLEVYFEVCWVGSLGGEEDDL